MSMELQEKLQRQNVLLLLLLLRYLTARKPSLSQLMCLANKCNSVIDWLDASPPRRFSRRIGEDEIPKTTTVVLRLPGNVAEKESKCT